MKPIDNTDSGGLEKPQKPSSRSRRLHEAVGSFGNAQGASGGIKKALEASANAKKHQERLQVRISLRKPQTVSRSSWKLQQAPVNLRKSQGASGSLRKGQASPGSFSKR